MNKKRIMKWIGLAVMLSMAPFVRATVDNNNPIANSRQWLYVAMHASQY